MRRLLLIILLFLFSCNRKGEENTVLRGFFPNAKDMQVTLYADDVPIDTAYLTKDKNFIFNMKLFERK